MDELPVPLTRRFTDRSWIALDVVFAAFLFTVSVIGLGHERKVPSGFGFDVAAYAGIAVACLALSARRRYPEPALGVSALSVGLLLGLGDRGPIVLTVGFAMYTLAASAPARLRLSIVGSTVGVVLAGALANGPVWGTAIQGAAVVLAGWLAGENARARRAYAQGLAERAAERELEREERARRAAADERVRIARELHDVVAHAMSIISVRSGVARMVSDERPEEAREALGIIESTSRRALAELRRLVGVLRQPEDRGAELEPAPGLADLPALVRQIGHAGVQVDLRIEGEARRLSPGEDLSAYRIAQEALTNVVQHVGPATATLRVRYTDGAVEIEVVDDGGGRGSEPGPAAEIGHGIAGMRERAALYGGELSAGPAGRGFRIHARLPRSEDAP